MSAKPKQLAFALQDTPPKWVKDHQPTPTPTARETNVHQKALSLSRRTDPETSHIAAEKMVATGQTKSQANLIEGVLLHDDPRLVARTPGEIAKHLNQALWLPKQLRTNRRHIPPTVRIRQLQQPLRQKRNGLKNRLYTTKNLALGL